MGHDPDSDDSGCAVSTAAVTSTTAQRSAARKPVPFALVHALLGAVAAGELEEAFERLIVDLGDWGVRAGALYIAEGELHRIAGTPIDRARARRLTLYDGYDIVGELHLELDGSEPIELLELLQDVFGLGLGRRVRTGQLDLIGAAVAVNSAESLDEALDALAEACRRIANAPNALVTIWDPDLRGGVIRAAAGDALAAVGERVKAGDHVAYRAAATDGVALGATGAQQGLGPIVERLLSRYAYVIAVPLVVDGAPPITFEIAWPMEPKPIAVERAITTVQKLGALTSVAFRAAEERAHAAHDALLRGVIETVPDGIVVRRGDREMLNAAARKILALPPEANTFDRAQLNIRHLDGTPVPPLPDPAEISERVGDGARTRYIVEVRGEDRVVEVSTAPMPEGYVSLFHDVTDEHTEFALTQEFLERLFESLPLAAVVLDAETGEVVRVNAAFVGLVGFEEDELVGVRPPYGWCDLFSTFEDVRHGSADSVYRHTDGRAVPVELLRVTVPGPHGTSGRMVLLARDLTERREFDRRLILSGKLAAIGELASGVAHEINNPLFAILGLVEFLLRDVEEGTKSHERLLLIQQTGLEIKEIVKALLDFARERTDDHQPMLVRDVVKETIELVRRTSAVRDVEIVERYLGEPKRAIGSANQIKQVILNLITNALQAMAATGGTITVTVESMDDWTVASVADSGPGIPPDVLNRIFEPFYTTKRDSGGTGLGLAVSHGIAEMHGGALQAESELGKGTTFTLRLPSAPEEE
jgi:PAS domain S-box-containing protein